MVFNSYAKYYDLLYKDKDYLKEVKYIESLIDSYSQIEVKNVLDIGCGTGIHTRFMSERGYNILGVDLSEEMVKKAQEHEKENLKYIVGDAKSFSNEKRFDVITSLFHVLSYQTTNDDLIKYFENVSLHLRKGGLFIFDFWYGPAVLFEKPDIRVKRLKNEEIEVTRIAEPVLNSELNTVDVNYDLFIKNIAENYIDNIYESHKMRYFFKSEIEQYLKTNNLCALTFEEWLTKKNPGTDTWGVCCVARREK